jgi:hypothetical protein
MRHFIFSFMFLTLFKVCNASVLGKQRAEIVGFKMW